MSKLETPKPRLSNKLKVIEAAGKLGVSQPMLSAWEGERKSPGLDNLENMADLYGVTTENRKELWLAFSSETE